MLMRRLLMVGIALVLLAGCGDDGGGEGGGGGEPGATLTGPLTYERGGGIAGRRDRLIVQPDGKAALTVRETTKSIELTDGELDKLVRQLEEADLPSLPANVTSKKPVPDTFGYRVAYDGATVTTDDPAMPDKLRGLVSGLGALVERYEK
jgi:hypothetical protein